MQNFNITTRRPVTLCNKLLRSGIARLCVPSEQKEISFVFRDSNHNSSAILVTTPPKLTRSLPVPVVSCMKCVVDYCVGILPVVQNTTLDSLRKHLQVIQRTFFLPKKKPSWDLPRRNFWWFSDFVESSTNYLLLPPPPPTDSSVFGRLTLCTLSSDMSILEVAT